MSGAAAFIFGVVVGFAIGEGKFTFSWYFPKSNYGQGLDDRRRVKIELGGRS